MNKDAYDVMMEAEVAYLESNGWVLDIEEGDTWSRLNRRDLVQGHAVNVQKQLDRLEAAGIIRPKPAPIESTTESGWGVWGIRVTETIPDPDGFRVSGPNWATDDGGSVITGSRKEIETKVLGWRAALPPGQIVTYLACTYHP